MEILFLAVLLLLMVLALSSGFPVAFALAGSAILSIGIAAGAGYLLEGQVDAYFLHGGPQQWLTSGVTNMRGVFWEVERDTLIAIPLFIFMGIMLQRSRIAEDLLVTIAQLFGRVPGGLGVSVVVVGGLLAATTGIVGATVVAMGMISLPAMMRHGYSRPLACGTIASAGTLGQIIPPSIVLIILADQLSSAVSQAENVRKSLYVEATGDLMMPSALSVASTSAGEMFLGALLPGLMLVGIYIAAIVIFALIRPQSAPAVHNEHGMSPAFVKQLILALVPPLTLIFAVLGSIMMGVATVNQAGAVGAAGAILMASYKLYEGRGRFWPALLALASLGGLAATVSLFNTNIRAGADSFSPIGITLAVLTSALLLLALGWATRRAMRIENTLNEVMVETAKSTALVFVVLLGAAMLTTAFRAFGGEDLVRDALNTLPGGFWTKFTIVMIAIFLLGFFLDFIEIAVVIVPIVTPILLSDPQANVTAVWLGVMIGMNLQTSFLTPPFGFALFYLRGVAPKEIRTTEIYKGVTPFIGLQVIALLIVGLFPPLVNYLPNRTALLAETAPPPSNPRLQYCVDNVIFTRLPGEEGRIRSALAQLATVDMGPVPGPLKEKLDSASSDLGKALDMGLTLAGERQDGAVDSTLFRRTTMRAHDDFRAARAYMSSQGDLAMVAGRLGALRDELGTLSATDLKDRFKTERAFIAQIPAALPIAAPLRRAGRALRSDTPDLAQIDAALVKALEEQSRIAEELAALPQALQPALTAILEATAPTLGILSRDRLPRADAIAVAACQSRHRDLSDSFAAKE